MKSYSKVAILKPAYNEEKNIEEVIKRVKKHVKGSKILVIDDGSQDKTYEIAKSMKVLSLKHKKNKGKGEALKTGFKKIKSMKNIDKIIIIDADLQLYAKDAPRIINALDDYDFVMGHRNKKIMPWRHRVGNFVWRNAFNIFFKQRMQDTNCGYIGIKKKIIKNMTVHGGYIIENSMLISAVRNNIRIGQVPVSVNYDKVSGYGRGIRMVLGVLFFIIIEGIKYRLKV